MKSTTKKWFTAAGIIIALGIIVGFIAVAASGFKLSALAFTDNREKHEYEIDPQDAGELNIKTISSDIILKKSQGANVEISCYENDNITFDFSVEDDTLKIEEKDNRKWYEYLLPFVNTNDFSLVVALPTDTWNTVNLETTSGDIKTTDISGTSFIADSTSGDINLIALHDEKLELNSTSGDITLKSCNNSSINAHSTSGSLTFDRTTAGEIICESTSGDICVTNSQDSDSLEASSTSGEVALENVVARTITLESTSGDIEFSKLDSESYDLNTTSGDIDGTIVGSDDSVTFFTDTTSGDVSVPYPSMGNKTFKATTVSGDIDIRFAK